MIKIDINKSVKCNEDISLFVSFPYDANIVDIIREQLIRYWDAENKRWELPFSSLSSLVSAFKNYEIEINADSIDVLFPKKAEVPSEFEFKTEPFAHQRVGFQFGLEHNKWFLGDEQGLGKTKEVIDIAVAKKLQNNYKHCLIICCVNGLKWNWQNEIATHSNESGYILGQRTRKDGKVVIGSNEDKVADLKNLPDDYFIITNIESLRSNAIITEIINLCNKGEISMIAADEVHKCFHYDTLVSTNLGELKIGDIVKNKMNVLVKSFNEQTNNIEWKEVTNWFENPVHQNLIELEIMLESGEIKKIKCTRDHKFYTKNRGWIEAQYLTEEDDIAEL